MKTTWIAMLLGVLLQGQSSVAEKKDHHPGDDVTCQTIPRNFLVNPSFETGDISPWVKFDSEICSLPIVVSDSSDDGEFVMKIGPAGGYWTAQQTVTELTIGKEYTLSFDYKPTTSGKFDLFIEENGHLLASAASVYKHGAHWKTISGTFKATESSHRVAILIWSEGGVLEIDNAKLIGPEKTQVCPSSAISSTAPVTPTSSAIPSSIAPSSTPAQFISSSAVVASSSPIPSVVLTSTPLRPSSTPLVSIRPSTIVSSQIIPSSSPISFSSIPISVPSSQSPSGTPSVLSSSAVPSEVPSSAVSSSVVTLSPYPISSTPLSRRPISTTPSPVLPSATPSSVPLESSTALPSLSSSVPQVSSPSSTVPPPGFTTSTIVSTHTATITACPSMVPDCPASEKSTFVTTETIVIDTTVCPITETSKPTAPQPTTGTQSNGVSPTASTTSTVFSTRTSTITACPSSVVDCPARQKSTYITTETILVSTTVCPGAASEVTSTAVVDSQPHGSNVSTSTVLTTRTATVTACPSTSTNCPASVKSTIVTTETLVASTVIVTIEAEPTATVALTTSGASGSSNSAGSVSSGNNVSGVAAIQSGAPSLATTFHRASSSSASVMVSSIRPSSTTSSASQKTGGASGTVSASGAVFTGSGFSTLKMIPVFDMLILLVASMFFLS